MDGNPQDNFQMSCPMIKLQSSDGEIFEVEVKVAKLSLTIKEMLDDLGMEECETIAVPKNAPEVSGKILGKIIQWANHHKDDPAAAEDDKKKVKPTDDIGTWDAEFLKVDQTTLFQIIRAADYLNIKDLLDVACKNVAKIIKGMTVEEVRQRFNVQNDFNPDEEQLVRKENAWCEMIYVRENRPVNLSVMDKITRDSLQNADDGAQVTEDCLANSVVIRNICQHFRNPELLKLSFLNKFWNDETRRLLKARGDVMAKLVCYNERVFQQTLEAFGSDLQRLDVVPYTGLIIEIDFNVDLDVLGGTAAVASAHEAILSRLPLKHLSIQMVGNWQKYKRCSAFLLAKKLLQDFSDVLEEITLNIQYQRARTQFVKQVFQDSVFPRLNILKLRERNFTQDEDYSNYMKALVPLAPSLKTLNVSGPIDLMENVLEGSSALLVYKSCMYYPQHEISDSLMSVIRPEKLKLFGTDMDLECFNRVPSLLQAPCFSKLRTLTLDEILACPLMSYGICLESIKRLHMNIHFQMVLPNILRILKNFDFTRIFPNLNEVDICSYSGHFELLPHHNVSVEQANAVLREPELDRAANIKTLNMLPGSLSSENACFIAEMFPNIEKLEVVTDEEDEILFGSIWTHWVDLKELKVKEMGDQIANLDSVLCGIFPEEVAELRQMDDEYLRKVNIVPVMPAITGLKDLKTLTIEFARLGCGARPNFEGGDGTFIFSKVARFIAFERCPSLTVCLEFFCCRPPPATRHLEPFAMISLSRC